MTAAIPAGPIAADVAMQSHGILGFEVITDAPRALDVRVTGAGRRSGWLRVRVGDDGTEQQLTGLGDPFVMYTRRDSLALGRGGGERVVARRIHRSVGSSAGAGSGEHSGDRHVERDVWSGDALDAADAESLARVLSLDVTLAVQGSSLIFDRSVYAPCTVRCVRAEACVQRDRQVATCANDIVICAACLERAQ